MGKVTGLTKEVIALRKKATAEKTKEDKTKATAEKGSKDKE